MNYKSSIYVGECIGESKPTYSKLKTAVWSSITSKVNGNQIIYKPDIRRIKYNDVDIKFTVNYPDQSGIVTVSFFPDGRDSKYWLKDKNLDVIKKVLEYCDLLGSKLQIQPDGMRIDLSRKTLSQDGTINTGKWVVTINKGDIAERKSLSDFSNMKSGDLLSKYIRNDLRIYPFTDFSNNLVNNISKQLDSLFSGLATVEKIEDLRLAKEQIAKKSLPENGICLFVDERKKETEWYKKYKLHFCEGNIPTQFLTTQTIDEKSNLITVRTNLMSEILTKSNKPPFRLRPTEGILDTGGFLCLSDFEDIKEVFFGALFNYSDTGIAKDEEIHIYGDINFQNELDKIEFDEKNLNLLGNKITALVAKDMLIDIIVTKKWKIRNLDRLVQLLKHDGIEVNRIYYVSTKTARFVDEYVLNEQPKTVNPYIIISEKTGYLRTSTKVRIFPNLQMIYISLLWPEEAYICKQDFEKILWLTKKRMYRPSEFDILSVPEPVRIFRAFKDLYVNDPGRRCTIPIRLLI